MIVVPPPVPAPYLASVPPLSEVALGVLASPRRPLAAERRLVDRELAERRNQLRIARQLYERQQGVRIAPEIPAE